MDIGMINRTPNRNLSRTTITIITIITNAYERVQYHARIYAVKFESISFAISYFLSKSDSQLNTT